MANFNRNRNPRLSCPSCFIFAPRKKDKNVQQKNQNKRAADAGAYRAGSDRNGLGAHFSQ